MTIKEAIKYGSDLLKENKIEDYSIKVKILISFITGIKKDILINYEDVEILDNKLEIYIYNLNKIIEGVPIQYITKKQEFMGLDFFVDENVLIPQPDTEILVEEVLKISKLYNKKINILDLCTGGGAIAVSLAKYIKDVNIIATDISENAIEIAEKNAIKNNAENKIKFVVSDMFKNIENEFDIIVSNPPYIETKEIEKLSKEVKNEPIIALDGGNDGIKYYKIIADNYNKFLNIGGYLLLEIGYNQGESVSKLFKNSEIKKDLSGNDRVILVKKE